MYELILFFAENSRENIQLYEITNFAAKLLKPQTEAHFRDKRAKSHTFSPKMNLSLGFSSFCEFSKLRTGQIRVLGALRDQKMIRNFLKFFVATPVQ